MSVTRQEKTVTVEKRSDSSETSATVTENGKSGSAKGATAGEALNRANDKAKGGIAVPPLPFEIAREPSINAGQKFNVSPLDNIPVHGL